MGMCNIIVGSMGAVHVSGGRQLLGKFQQNEIHLRRDPMGITIVQAT